VIGRRGVRVGKRHAGVQQIENREVGRLRSASGDVARAFNKRECGQGRSKLQLRQLGISRDEVGQTATLLLFRDVYAPSLSQAGPSLAGVVGRTVCHVSTLSKLKNTRSVARRALAIP